MLSKEMALGLLQRLSADDAFRADYEKSPASALQAAGLPSELIKGLPAENLAAGRLLPKQDFAKSLEQVRANAANVFLCLHPPSIRLQSGDAARDSATATPFLERQP